MEAIGWISSALLLTTLVRQVYKQWDEKVNEGVSKWLFIGQLGASLGFTAYSFSTGNWVFVFTNLALSINNVLGIYIFYKNREREG